MIRLHESSAVLHTNPLLLIAQSSSINLLVIQLIITASTSISPASSPTTDKCPNRPSLRPARTGPTSLKSEKQSGLLFFSDAGRGRRGERARAGRQAVVRLAKTGSTKLHLTRGQWPCSASGQAVERGCGGVKAMEVKSDFKFELTDLNCLCSHITCHNSQC